MGVRDGAIVYFDGVLKLLGVSHGLFGGLLIVLGIVVRIVVDHWTSIMLLALWIGVVIAATGAIAVRDSNMENTDNSRKYYLVDFLLFTVISLLLSTMLIVCYSMAVHTAFTSEEIGSFAWYSDNSFLNQNMLRVKIFTILVLILGCLEFLLCVVSIGYFAYSYRRDYGKKPRADNATYSSYHNQRPAHDDMPFSYVNETYGENHHL